MRFKKKFAEASEGIPEVRRILLRIGINLGDVIGEGSDIYGDGVNIAARLEALAERCMYLGQGDGRDRRQGHTAF